SSSLCLPIIHLTPRPRNGRTQRGAPRIGAAATRKTALRTLPSCAKKLVVPSGSDTNRKPSAFDADQVIVASHITSSPSDPSGLFTFDRSVTGGLQWMSKLHVASTGSSKRK